MKAQPTSGTSGTLEAKRHNPGLLAELLVRGSLRHPWLVIIVSTLLAVAGLYVSVTRFAITTETDQLLHSDAAWGRDKSEFQAAFPQLAKVILVVVDGETPELAEAGASRLAAALTSKPGPHIEKVWRPDAGPYFEKSGLLLLPTEELKGTLGQMREQAPVLSALAGDPTLRGLARLIQLGASQGSIGENSGLLDRLSEVVERVLAGQPARLSWQELMSGKQALAPNQLRKFVLVEPILDYNALQPGAATSDRIRAAAAELGLTAAGSGTRVRLTGLPPLADEEFGTVQEGAPLHLGLTVVAIAVILYLALRSGRLIFAVLATTAAGLVVTIGTGLLLVGRFNVISVAVAALFLGLGVDFSIQLAVRYRDERHKLHELRRAILATASGMGWSLTLAAMSLIVGFFSFLPTEFTGVAELGLITGVGMVIAFVASLTLLPALIYVMPPPPEPESIEMPRLAKVDHWILAHRKLVIVSSIAVVVAGLPFLLRLDFDANPMHLRDEKTEAVATFLDLSRTPGMSPNSISVLAPSLETARPLAAKLAGIPEVSRVTTVLTFVPDNQDEKLALIRETAEELSDIVGDRPPAPAPTDAELQQALRRAADALLSKTGTDAASAALRRLGENFKRLADGSPEQRTRAQAAIAGGLPQLLAGLRTALGASRVTLADLPADLRRDWIAPDGRVRIEVYPKGDGNDNEVLETFTAAVEKVAPNLSGGPVDIVESGKIIGRAFATAALLALLGVFGILTLALRRAKDVALTLGPLVVATIMTLEAAQLIGMPLNLANVIALPLMLAVGVAFHIYYMIAWREGVADMLASSLTRAIFFSSLTTGVAFGSLWLSNHPGTASMGKLLTISLFFTLVAAFIMVPAFLGPPRTQAATPGEKKPT